MRFAASPGFLGAYGLMDSFDPNEMTDMGMQGRSMQNTTAMAADADVRGSELAAEAMLEKARLMGPAMEAQGSAQGQASMASGIGSMVSSFAPAIGGGGGGGIFAQKGAEAFAGAQGSVNNMMGNVGSFMGSLY